MLTKILTWFFILTLGLGIYPAITLAEVPPTEIKVSLGNSQGELKFFPNQLDLEVGKKYKLVLDNPSSVKHYFTAKDFANASWTQKVEVGKVEIKGAIRELELKPTGAAEWFIVPMKAGSYQLYCSILGHAQAGMTGEIIVSKS
jgi:uncharacterized cupredoxin-like copper-binding protein